MVLIFPVMLGKLGHINPYNPLAPAHAPVLSDVRKQHLLYGNATGGGHLHGVGHACESEFPADWTADMVVANVMEAAANDNLNWQQQQNGNFVAETMEAGVQIRVVLDNTRSEIITAYPVSLPRNPCPNGRAANEH